MNIYRKIINTKPRYPDGFDSKLKSLIKHLLRRDLSKRFGNLKDGVKISNPIDSLKTLISMIY